SGETHCLFDRADRIGTPAHGPYGLLATHFALIPELPVACGRRSRRVAADSETVRLCRNVLRRKNDPGDRERFQSSAFCTCRIGAWHRFRAWDARGVGTG